MRRPLTALFAALEALLVVGVGIGIPLLPLTLLWAVQYGLQIDWVVFWRAAVDVWLLGHGVDVTFTLSPAQAATIGGGASPFVVTIAPLAFALLTGLLGARAGRRIGETPHGRLGQLVAIGVFAGLSVGVTLSALSPSAQPSLWQGILLPTLVFALGAGVGSEISRRGSPSWAENRADHLSQARAEKATVGSAHAGADARPDLRTRTSSELGAGPRLGHRVRELIENTPHLGASAAIALRGGAMATALVLSCASVAVALQLATHYGQVIALYEGVHAGALGGAALTIGQLAVIPNLVVWTASWFAGPGFAIGSGSLVSPLGTGLGPIPALPVFGALPTADLAWGFLGLLVPVIAGFLAGAVLRRRVVAAGLVRRRWLAVTGILIGVASGLLLGALAWMSAGAAGPGRLAEVGPSFLSVGAVTLLEVGLPAVLSLLVGSRRSGVTGGSDEAGHADSGRESVWPNTAQRSTPAAGDR